MSDDDDLEQLLARYRAAGPPPRLRARLLAAPRRPVSIPHLWLWTLPSAAAIAIALNVASTANYRAIAATVVEPSLAAREQLVQQLAADFGGGERGRAEASRVVRETEEALAAAGPAPEVGQ